MPCKPRRLASIPPERLSRASLIQTLYPNRTERQLVTHIKYSLQHRRFVGLTMGEAVWDHSSFSTNRDLLLNWAAGVVRQKTAEGR